MFGDEQLIKIHRGRIFVISNIILFSFLIILIRLWYLQVYKGEQLHLYSVENRLRKEIVRAPRGMIFSRDGDLIVDNTPRFDAIVTPQYLKNKEQTLERLAMILSMDKMSIEKILQKKVGQAKYLPVIVKKNIEMDEVAKLEVENALLPGVSVNPFISREYKDREIGAHLLGYIAEITQQQLPIYRKRDNLDYKLGDFIGQFGLEQILDQTLRGENGHEFVEVDALGRKKKYINTDNLFKGIEDLPSSPGDNVYLTIDRDLQKIAYESLEGQVGSLVAMDVETGEILAMVSRPAFDPSQFSKGLTPEYWAELSGDPFNPLRDRNIQEHYSPGSTFKPFTAIAALETGIVTPETPLRCHGVFRLGRRLYHSWKKYGTEKVKIVDALMQSCNIYFYKVATELDIDTLANYSRMFGLGSKTEIDLPREVSGLMPTKDWKIKQTGEEWQMGETLSCAIGQSYVLVSTMQLVRAYAAIANRGKLLRPQVVKKVESNDGEVLKELQPDIIREIKLKDSTWDAIQEGLYKVMNGPEGTARYWRYKNGRGLQMSGKTGTSQVVKAGADKLYEKCIEKPYEFRHHGLFVGYLPYKKPKVAIAALVEHGCGGSTAAAPVVVNVASAYMQKYLPDDYEKNFAKEKEQLQKIYAAYAKAQQEREKKEHADAAESDDEITEVSEEADE